MLKRGIRRINQPCMSDNGFERCADGIFAPVKNAVSENLDRPLLFKRVNNHFVVDASHLSDDIFTIITELF